MFQYSAQHLCLLLLKEVLNLKCTFSSEKIGWLYLFFFFFNPFKQRNLVTVHHELCEYCSHSSSPETEIKHFQSLGCISEVFLILMHLQATQNNKKGKWCELIETLDFSVVE